MTEQVKHDLPPEALFGHRARQKMLEGVEFMAKAVMCTLGPRGHNVVIERKGRDHILTKDGVTVAKHINLRDPYKQMGLQICREAAQRTNDVAGDGTTTAVTLTHAIFSGGMKLLAAGHSAADIKRGIDVAVMYVIESLRNNAIHIDDTASIVNVGTISANGEREIGELLARAMEHVGRDGVITVEEAKGLKTSLDIVDGARFDRGYLSSYFATDAEKMCCELHEPIVMLSNMKLSAAADVLPLFEAMNRQKRSLLIIADDVEGEVMQLMLTNHMRGLLRCCAIKAPAFGDARIDMLNDMAALVGGRLLTTGDSLTTAARVDDLMRSGAFGTCKRVMIDRSRTTIVGAGGQKDVIESRASMLRESLADPTLQGDARALLQERLSKLAGGVAIVRVGGSTEVEMLERKYRVDDALNATQAAVIEGVVPGGGVALVRAAAALAEHSFADRLSDAEMLGVKLIVDACRAPLRKIVSNAGKHAPVIVEERVTAIDAGVSFGYDAATATYVDVVAAGILDPVRVTRVALENAASVAGLLLTVDSAIIDTTDGSHGEM